MASPALATMEVSVIVSIALVTCCAICAATEPGTKKLVKFCAISPGIPRMGNRSPSVPAGVTTAVRLVIGPEVTVEKPVKKRLTKASLRVLTAPLMFPASRSWSADSNAAGYASRPTVKSCAAFESAIPIVLT